MQETEIYRLTWYKYLQNARLLTAVGAAGGGGHPATAPVAKDSRGDSGEVLETLQQLLWLGTAEEIQVRCWTPCNSSCGKGQQRRFR